MNLNEELRIIPVDVYPDDRGSFAVPWAKDKLVLKIDELVQLVPEQMNVSHSTQGVVRGMHWQASSSSIAKYVYCSSGKIFDQVVDLRKDCPTFGKAYSFELDQHKALYVPCHFAHGFQCLSETATVVYLQSGPYDPQQERAINAKGYLWPTGIKEQSEKDRKAPSLEDIADEDLF